MKLFDFPSSFGLKLGVVLLLAGGGLCAQQPAPRKIDGPVRNAGVLRLRDGAFLRGSTASLGADVIYSNRCDVQYYEPFIAAGETILDEGRLPSPTSPNHSGSRQGCAVAYTITGFELAYCTDLSDETIVVDLFERYPGCAPSSASPDATFVLTGLPGTTSPGAVACWTIAIDITGLPTSPLVLQADADGSFQGGPYTNDRFGMRLAFPLTQGNSGAAFGNYAGACEPGAGTVWDANGYDPDRPGVGIGTLSQFYIEGIPTPGCYYVDGAPIYSFYLRMFADACPIGGPGVGFCSGDGSATPCPCGEIGQSYNGCPNSVTQAGARLAASGNPSLTQDTLVLEGSSMTNGTVLYFQGTNRMNSGLGTVFGDGLRCAGGTVTRLGASTNVDGASAYPAAGQLPISVQGQIASPGIRTYQAWYRNAASFCTPATFNLSNGYEVSWLP